jgi:hypothetical protein
MLVVAATPQHALAWGDDGHKIVALIAEHYLSPDVRNTVNALLAQHNAAPTCAKSMPLAKACTRPRRSSIRSANVQ